MSDKIRLAFLEPGHFHAALCLREPHPRLAGEVFVYAAEGPDLQHFLALVESFNSRAEAPTAWQVDLRAGPNGLARLCAEQPADAVILAGRNDTKLAAIHTLHAAGLPVLADKPWLIDAATLPLLQDVVTGAPLAMDIMSSRQSVANRLVKALIARGVAGSLRGIDFTSRHHLYKLVNDKPLVRPDWYFDTEIQGEGINDLPSHYVDMALWLAGNDDVALVSAQQTATEVPRETYTAVTGLDGFPDALSDKVSGDTLALLSNALLKFTIAGVPVSIDAAWNLAVPEGGGDSHGLTVRGSAADLVVDHSAETGFATVLSATPHGDDSALRAAVQDLAADFPGIALDGSQIVIPDALDGGHEAHFALVLDTFLNTLGNAAPPADLAKDLAVKYGLLAAAKTLAHAND
jgi:predicted dehydrogenase